MPTIAKLEDRYLDRPYILADRLIDPIAGTSTYAGERAVLKRKHLEVLACLAAAGTAMVSREAFIDLVWRGNALVGENGLNNAMSAVRRALQDTDAEKPLIRTIPRRGYQLTVAAGDVEEAVPEAFAPGMPIAGKPGWHLVRRMGGNATSELWVAQEQTSGDKRAFRFCRSEQHLQALRRETTMLRYLREALAGRQDTAVVLDWQLDEPPYHLEMDYASGGTLAEWAAAQGGIGRVAYAERLRLTAEVVEALAAVHAADVVHRNLGPSSVSIHADQDEAELHAHLGEFGLSDLTDHSRLKPLQITNAGLTLTGEEAGEALYLPPENSSGGKATAAGDVYAFGVLLLQMAVGDLQRAPGGDWEASVASQPLRELIAKCLSATPEARPNAAVVAEWLRAFAQAARDAGRSDLGTSHAGTTPAHAEAPVSVPAQPHAVAPGTLDPAVGSHVGPYRLIDTLGEGGMGAVYLAEQREPVQRKVALKVVRTGLMSGDVRARFEAERQALALMHHANVASVFDAGNTPSGQPYFAMEYVQGQDITAHCDQLCLDFRGRITLFLQVCDGVLHAHQKGLIHRDLKPGNILVSRVQDQPAAVKIIDFGVAKSMSGLLAANPAHTRLGSFVGTPTYSSPEQVSGPVANVDTRSDIYSLGVVLYQLLAGVTPYSDDELNRKTPVELSRLLSGEHPPSPLVRYTSLSREEEQSIADRRALTVEEMKAALGADVSWIVGKCLEVDPDDRYPSVLELEKDLRRWLQNLPVQARPASRLYRMRKFVRRHRLGVAAATLGTLALLGTTGAAIYGYVRAEKALEEAEMAAEFQVKQMQSIDAAAIGLSLRSRLIQSVQKRGAERGWEPAAVAQGQQQLGMLIEGVSFTDLSLDQLDTHTFLPTLASINKDYNDHPLLQARLWQSLADTLVKLGRLEAAVEPQRLALEQRRQVLGDDDPLTLVSLRSRGELLLELGRHEEAEADLRAAMTGMRRVLGNNHPETLTSLIRLSYALSLPGRKGKEDSMAYAREALAGSRQALGENDPITLEAISNMGICFWYQRRYPDAEKYFREALNKHLRVYGKQHQETMDTMNNLAVLLMDTGRFAEAETMVLQVLAYQRIHLGNEHPSTLSTQGDLGTVLDFEGRHAEAEPFHRQVVGALRRSLGEEHPDTLSRSIGLATNLSKQGKIDEAIALNRHILSISRRTSGDEDHLTLTLMTSLAVFLQMKGESDEASALMQDMLESRRRTLGDTHRYTLAAIVTMASLSKAQGDLKQAEKLLREALAGQRKTLGDDNRATLDTIDKLGQVLHARGQLDEAMALGQQSIEIASKANHPGQRSISLYQVHYGRMLLDMRRYEDAEGLFQKAKVKLSQEQYPDIEAVEELIQAFVALYSQRHKAQPDQGYDAKAELWGKKLDALKDDRATSAPAILSDRQASR
jgi:eukaryotic-like serine/threonine-protein kinase